MRDTIQLEPDRNSCVGRTATEIGNAHERQGGPKIHAHRDIGLNGKAFETRLAYTRWIVDSQGKMTDRDVEVTSRHGRTHERGITCILDDKEWNLWDGKGHAKRTDTKAHGRTNTCISFELE